MTAGSTASAVEMYVGGFLARCDVLRGRGQSLIDRPGVHGVVSSEDPGSTRLLIDDDKALEVLPDLLAKISGGILNVLSTAARVVDTLERHDQWQGAAATAMVARDLRTTPATLLPADLAARAVSRTDQNLPTDVPLIDAVALAVRADPDGDSPDTDALAAHLRAAPQTVRLFAAVDGEGRVLGTSGIGVFGRYAYLILVNTDPSRRGEGIGRAMTAVALADARSRGATSAYVDASNDGRRLYEAMGFETAGTLTRFIGLS